MASLMRRGDRFTVRWHTPAGERPMIPLGTMSEPAARVAVQHVEALLAARRHGETVPAQTLRWLAGLSDDLHAAIAGHGLVEKRVRPGDTDTAVVRLGAFIDEFIAARSDVKPLTVVNWQQVRKALVRHFGEDKPIAEITPGDAEDFRHFCLRSGLNENTTRRNCRVAKQFFKRALKKKLVAENPFSDLKVTIRGNRERQFFVTREAAEKVLAACTDDEWRLCFSLSRYAGLRVPSELLRLRWADVDWDGGKMLIHSPKTEHHDGHGTRWVPIFPELRPLMLRVFEDAEPGTVYVVTRYRDTNVNLRTPPDEDHQAGRPDALAAAVAQPAIDATDRA